MKRSVYILVLLLFALPCFGDVHYINPDVVGGDDNGTSDANAWDSCAKIEAAGWVATDTYAFKCGTTATNCDLDVDAANVTITAYYGTDTLENASPSYGTTCGNSDAKPIIQGAATLEHVIIADTGATDLTIDSVQVTNSGDGYAAIMTRADDLIVQYSVVGKDCDYGIRVGPSGYDGDNAIVRYNLIDSDAFATNNDGIILLQEADNASVYYNTFNNWDHASIALYLNAGTNGANEIYYNKIIDDSDTSSECLNLGSSLNNIVHHNYCEGAGVNILRGQDNLLYFNVFNEIEGTVGADDACIKTQNIANTDVRRNKAWNNTCYQSGSPVGGDSVNIYAGSGSTGDISDNEYINNIFLGADDDGINISDDSAGDAVIGSTADNIFYNNCVYNFGDDYGRVATNGGTGTSLTTASLFNSHIASNSDMAGGDNVDTDPGLTNPATGDFTISSTGSNAYQGGYTITGETANLWNQPFCSGTDFTTTPITVSLCSAVSSGEWPIGAFGYESSPPAPSGQLQGISMQGIKLN